MNWKVLVNILLVVLLLHFIIKNLQYAYGNKEGFTNPAHGTMAGTNEEQLYDAARKLPQSPDIGSPIPPTAPTEGPYDRSDEPVQKVNMDKEHFNAIQFLTTPEENYDNVFYLNQETDRVKQANVYSNDWNVANFQSNVLDVRNFFKVSPPQSGSNLPHRDLELQDETVSDIAGQACFANNSNASGKTVQPDIWKYKNEFPMNGGKFLNIGSQSVYGFSDGDNTFSVFDGDDPLTASNCKPDTECNKCPDDIRNGLGVPGRKWWSRN